MSCIWEFVDEWSEHDIMTSLCVDGGCMCRIIWERGAATGVGLPGDIWVGC
jgi:hypothetical protein